MIEYEKRAMIEAEDKYTFRQSTQISMQTGLIGHLRADMDTDGNGFFSSWFDFREELKTDEFKAEFDDVINSLREEGDILHNRRALAKYCYCTPQSRMQEEPGYPLVGGDADRRPVHLGAVLRDDSECIWPLFQNVYVHRTCAGSAFRLCRRAYAEHRKELPKKLCVGMPGGCNHRLGLHHLLRVCVQPAGC